jgi:hypothetical protein
VTEPREIVGRYFRIYFDPRPGVEMHQGAAALVTVVSKYGRSEANHARQVLDAMRKELTDDIDRLIAELESSDDDAFNKLALDMA